MIDKIDSGLKCQVNWVDCNDHPTGHDQPAVAYAAIVVDHHVKRYAICAQHMQTLLKRTLHHDLHCQHMAEHSTNWSIIEL